MFRTCVVLSSHGISCEKLYFNLMCFAQRYVMVFCVDVFIFSLSWTELSVIFFAFLHNRTWLKENHVYLSDDKYD